MTGRLVLFGLGAVGLGALLAAALARLPGPHVSPYGQAVVDRVRDERHATNAVTAVNFDYRGFDTLGEEFILFAAVTGSLVLLREAEDVRALKRIDAVSRARAVAPTDAVRIWTLAMTGPIVVFGGYIVTHGALTPGGGFQGGVLLATAPLLIYLAESYETFKRVTSQQVLEVVEALGVGAFALTGLAGPIVGAAYLQNVVPLGPSSPASVISGGTIPIVNLATGCAVAGGFTLLLSAFLQRAFAGRS